MIVVRACATRTCFCAPRSSPSLAPSGSTAIHLSPLPLAVSRHYVGLFYAETTEAVSHEVMTRVKLMRIWDNVESVYKSGRLFSDHNQASSRVGSL